MFFIKRKFRGGIFIWRPTAARVACAPGQPLWKPRFGRGRATVILIGIFHTATAQRREGTNNSGSKIRK